MRIVIIVRVHPETSSWPAHAASRMQAAGLRRGGARLAVIEHLGTQTCCRSAQEIHEGIRNAGGTVGIASVYRALETLAELGLVQRVDLGDGVARFEAASTGSDHHHHLVCDDCGRVEPFHDERLELALSRTADRLGLELSQHEVVLHGACAHCRDGKAAGCRRRPTGSGRAGEIVFSARRGPG
jgi:Fur family ferric uptake transcriptional regulator